jgi:hypothetical protein
MSAVETATTGDKPVFLFDIDGTLLLWTTPPPKGYDYYPVRPKMKSSIEAYSPEHPKWFRTLLKKEVEVAYISLWLEDSHKHYGEQLGLPEFPHVPFIDYGPYKQNRTKATAITELYGSRPVALFDDEISIETVEWARARIDQGAPTFLCKPDKLRGIQPEDIEAANQWLGNLVVNTA